MQGGPIRGKKAVEKQEAVVHKTGVEPHRSQVKGKAVVCRAGRSRAELLIWHCAGSRRVWRSSEDKSGDSYYFLVKHVWFVKSLR